MYLSVQFSCYFPLLSQCIFFYFDSGLKAIVFDCKGGDIDCYEIAVFSFGYIKLSQLTVFGEETIY